MDALSSILFSKKSSRHHFIPRFLLEGFKNSEEVLYVYDKQNDRILLKPRSPKSLFFELDRNTIDVTTEISSSGIEDLFYGKIDNDASKVVRKFQEDPLDKISFELEETGSFSFFLITLYWRIPYNDHKAEDLVKRAKFISPYKDLKSSLEDPVFIKMQRSRMFKDNIDNIKLSGKEGTTCVNIHQFDQEVFVIGDNPILFKINPEKMNEFDEEGLLMAISSNRIYSSTPNKLDNFTFENALSYNIGVINQSLRYVAASNHDVLSDSVKKYKLFQEENCMHLLPKLAFNS